MFHGFHHPILIFLSLLHRKLPDSKVNKHDSGAVQKAENVREKECDKCI